MIEESIYNLSLSGFRTAKVFYLCSNWESQYKIIKDSEGKWYWAFEEDCTKNIKLYNTIEEARRGAFIHWCNTHWLTNKEWKERDYD